mmetsp:Transcript_6471/g.10203  ORF Transcript_6471/g.10203 Transcript_6471/m.10203 type:complete len:153 (+) Transcript_6471:412-870(+)|eukprot:CAMPEP_0203756936 /NCGR_PEP_ID=MMETSP0098-20131031/10120_1 /ASSEMBLY_ACC=CAM_ASM_000208 /TAXON_ID=96639 /ORGANISM=" , Strain NY0313808BC1" /LENGTH=152 /DNA_ID=CAMNT_0050648995 /DNA_START=120 /DNA_END=578 /DNA_ORIENTATION=+
MASNNERSLAWIEPKWKRWALYEDVSEENREIYFKVSERPLSIRVEDDLELLSGVVTGESYRDLWDMGQYMCSRCNNLLYSSQDKWKGPCVWPSFRKAAKGGALLHVPVEKYYSYTCVVEEIYCSKCELFLGHAFEDGIAKGDVHEGARWRH